MRFKKSTDQNLSEETNMFTENSNSSIETPTPVNSSHINNDIEQTIERQNLICYLSCCNISGRNYLTRRNAFGDIWNFEA